MYLHLLQNDQPESKLQRAWSNLSLHQHSHVHKHVVQLPDAGLQADDVLMTGLDLAQGLPGDLRVGDDLHGGKGYGPLGFHPANNKRSTGGIVWQ